MNRIKVLALLVVLAALAAACAGGGGDGPAPKSTQTPTSPAVIEPGGELHPADGTISLEFLDAETQLTCTAEFPFAFDWDQAPAVIAGGGEINCPLVTEQCGEVCLTYHIEYVYQGELSGFVHQSTEPGSLQADLILDGSLTQYWTDIPPDSVVAFTEEHPMVLETTEILSLVFDFEDGAVFSLENTTVPGAPPWVFTLHLGKE